MAEKQVDRVHYFDTEYNTAERFTSFAEQYQLVRNAVDTGSNVMEVGPGNKILTHLLRESGYDVTTVDIAEDIEPDITADVRELPFEEDAFDAVCLYEVLEHIPFEDVETALKEVHRVAKDHVFVSVPQVQMTVEVSVKIPLLSRKNLNVYAPAYRFADHEFEGQHYWEMGKKGYSKQRVERLFSRYFQVQDTFVNPYNTFHRFYWLKSRRES